jgi:hypothetical protein
LSSNSLVTAILSLQAHGFQQSCVIYQFHFKSKNN